jgi:HPt (histidine-containing phosphotransfer) domain-containing protein
MIDWTRVAELRSEIGEDDFVEVIVLFLEETDEVIARLRLGDRTRLVHDLHFLKGSALNLGLSGLAQLCHDGERACASGRAPLVDLEKLVACHDHSRIEFSAGLATHPAA